MHLSKNKASDKGNPLKAVYKRLEAMEKKNGCSQRRGSFTKRSLTRMYFERWGLLAPPPRKVSFPKICLLNFPNVDIITQTYKGVPPTAFGRAGVQEAVT